MKQKVKTWIKRFVKLFLSERMYMNLTRWVRVHVRGSMTPHTQLAINVHVVEHCNLSCATCSVYSPLVAEEKFLSPDSFERDMARLRQLTEKVSAITLVGGEPLLHPAPDIFFGIIRKYFPDNTTVCMVTNGILLHRQPESFWESCRRHRAQLTISRYPIKIKIDQLRAAAQKYGVRVDYPPRDDFFKIPLDVRGEQKVEYSFKKCLLANYCIELLDGKLYPCCVPGHIGEFNRHFGQNLEVTEGDYVDIYKAKDIAEVFEHLSRPIPFCRYCNLKAFQKNIGWALSKKRIEEWT
jgi:hypothetical protein